MKIVVDFFGVDRPVQQITTPVVQEFLGWLRAHGGRRHKDRKTGQLAGAGCSDQTYNRYKSYLSTIFKFGMRCGYNTINPVELIEAAPVWRYYSPTALLIPALSPRCWPIRG